MPQTLFRRSIVALSFCIASAVANPLPPSQLRCEYLKNPEAVDVSAPRFAWILNHTDRAQKQTAYELQVSKDPQFTVGSVWATGKVTSPQSIQVEYKGQPLSSDTDYFWRVRYWDASGAESPWSETARFSTGLLEGSDWKAKWIGGGTLLRSDFNLKGRIRRARAFVAAQGYYELHINGQRIGHHVLDPAWTDYNKRVLYSTYDVTQNLMNGQNAVGVMLGKAWYGKTYGGAPRFICQIRREYGYGKPFTVVSDDNWQAFQSPVVGDDIYDGETYDARLEGKSQGQPVKVEAVPAVLSSQMMPAMEVVDTLSPQRMVEASPGSYVYDFGQNFSGWVRLKAQGPAGTKVRIRYAELADPDGAIRVDNLRSARSTDTYILRGDPDGEEYETHFTYHGFRYAELTGFPGVPTLDAVRGREVHTAVEATGNFTSANALLNGMQHMFLWSIKTNLASVPTDCNQRDERLGWMGDAHLSAETAILNFDMAAFYTNFLRDIQDAQGSGGEVPNIVPYISRFNPNRIGDPAWGVAYPLIAQFMYENYGDTRVFEQHYPHLKAWADFLHRHAPDGIVDYSYFGDWVAIDPTPKLLAATWAYLKSLDTVALAAHVVGKEEDAKQYRALAAEVRSAFVKRFGGPAGYFGDGSQTAQVLALDAHVMPDKAVGGISTRLLDDLNYYHNVHLTTGILGTKYLFPVLAGSGHADMAYEVLTQPDYPGYGYMLSHGATTLWELWQERTGPEMNSHNHHMFASAGTFFYNVLAGINRGEGAAYEQIRIEPQLVHGLNWVSAQTMTPYGQLESAWRRLGAGYELKINIPIGSEATVYLPVLKLSDLAVIESGKAVYLDGKAQGGVFGVSGFIKQGDRLVGKVGSGRYAFTTVEREQLKTVGGTIYIQ